MRYRLLPYWYTLFAEYALLGDPVRPFCIYRTHTVIHTVTHTVTHTVSHTVTNTVTHTFTRNPNPYRPPPPPR